MAATVQVMRAGHANNKGALEEHRFCLTFIAWFNDILKKQRKIQASFHADSNLYSHVRIHKRTAVLIAYALTATYYKR
jgi:hypothetical protein